MTLGAEKRSWQLPMWRISLHRKLRFSLKWAMLVFTLLCVCLCWYANDANNQRRAVEKLAKHNATIRYDFEYDVAQKGYDSSARAPGPDWLRDLVGRHYFDTAVQVELKSGQVTDEVIRALGPYLEDMPRLRDLGLWDTAVTDASLAQIGRLSGLERFVCNSPVVTDEGLGYLVSLKNLWCLGLFDTQITDRGLVHLKKLPHLRELAIQRTNVSDEGIRVLAEIKQLRDVALGCEAISDVGLGYLAGLTELESLSVTGPNITGVGLEHLRGLRNLRHLSLRYSRIVDEDLELLQHFPELLELDLWEADGVTDRGLRYLAALKTLRGLILYGTSVGNEGLKHIAGLKNLEWVNVQSTNVKERGEAIKQLQKALPACQILDYVSPNDPRGTKKS